MSDIRKPIGKKANETKDKIIEKGFTLMCNEGYHNVNCIDIAKFAGVSTGIIYQYFTDKRDIFISGVNKYAEDIMFPMINVLKSNKVNTNNLRDILSDMIDKFIKNHKLEEKAHEELMAMSYLDEDIKSIFTNYEMKVTDNIVNILKSNNIIIDNAYEKVHLIYGIIDNYCHEVVYHKHENLDYQVMKSIVLNAIICIL